MTDIKENLKKLPDSPGVYLHKDKLGQVIYVGKAVSLKNRVRQYFQSSKNMDNKVKAMVKQIHEFEYINCGSEMEALILENNLIKEYMPKYNVLLRDDKTYPYIKITNEEFPRIQKTRTVLKDGGKYYGPFSDATAVNQMIDLLNSTYSLKKCAMKDFPKNHRPCLNYHIGQCDGVCISKISKEAYNEKIKSIDEFLKGKKVGIVEFLTEKMNLAAEELRFEEAARYRDYLAAAKILSEKQRVVLSSDKDMDIVLQAGKNQITVFFVREGKLSGREVFDVEFSFEEEDAEIVSAFLKQHYGKMTSGPKEILLAKEPKEVELIEEYLEQLWGKRVTIGVPKRGEKKAILDLAKRDVAETSSSAEERRKKKVERKNSVGREVCRIINVANGTNAQYDDETYRVEAYDISNTNGVDTVGAMIVFDGLEANKKAYRKFKVKTAESYDDYGSMQEVLFRRIKRAIDGDPGFLPYPDLILVDGGKGHVGAVIDVLNALDVKIPVVGMAKDDSHRTKDLVYKIGEEFLLEELKDNTLLFQYLGRIQEEVHRFVIEYHRGIRDKKNMNSVLDQIEGIGPKKRNDLLTHFGSVNNVKNAQKMQLMEVKGITEKIAMNIIEFFH
ncbi:MAG: excinuclease ABC subunit UvrC [Anaerovoracaceae bacterium]